MNEKSTRLLVDAMLALMLAGCGNSSQASDSPLALPMTKADQAATAEAVLAAWQYYVEKP